MIATAPLSMRILLQALLLTALVMQAGCGTRALKYPHAHKVDYSVSDAEFRRTIGALLGPPLVEGNQTTTLVNGAEIFPAMLEAIASAQKTVTLETYIYWSGTIGKQFTDVLCERARAGVPVYVIVDALGSAAIEQRYVEQMEDAGARVIFYNKIPWYMPIFAPRVNNRTHRKLLVVDGRIGFIGGVGIADQWLGDGDAPEEWRDNHYRIEGPAVANLQATFVDNWMQATGQVLHGDDFFPPLEAAGTQTAQVFASSPEGGSSSMHLMYLLSFAAARHSILIGTPYFVPDEEAIAALLEARKRGVQVQVIVPGPVTDRRIVNRASRARWGDLLKAGAEIYEFQPTLYHCKLMVVDDLWVSVGSANLDNRSLRLSDEANLNIIASEFALEQRRIFEDDLTRSRRISLEEWEDRPLSQKLMDRAASLLGPQL